MYDALKQIGNWPPETNAARKEKLHVHIPPEKTLKLIHGKDHHTRIDLFISNEQCHVGIHTVPGGKFADPETNAGDKCILVLKGKMQIRVLKSESDETSVSTPAWEVKEHEVFFIPEGIRHQVFNLGKGTLQYLFTVAPKL
jgi:mannose-6-phosphate isomerase-like protein (cupin superfamily)